MRAPRLLATGAVAALITILVAGPAAACGGLIGPNGAVNLLRTTTFAGYHDGVEHYVTAFNFAGGGGAFGSIIPLPGVPTEVVKGGDWTLQRLLRETAPRFEAFAGAAAPSADRSAQVLLEVKIDALDITVLKGGGDQVGTWAKEHGFRLSPDAPEVLDFYADRSPIFLAAAFDAKRAADRGQNLGDGTPVHITIPTTNPWVPLRILGLGKQGTEPVNADVFLLTDRRPALLPAPDVSGSGLVTRYSSKASTALLADLRSDRGMEWIPASGMHLTHLAVEATAGELRHDLAIDASGQRAPSRVAAGLVAAGESSLPSASADSGQAWLVVAVAVAALVTGLTVAAAVRR